MTAARDLKVGDLVEMEPVYLDFELEDTGAYLIAQSEYGEVETIDFEGDDDDLVVVGFTNLSTFALPAEYDVFVDMNIDELPEG